jgi:hypothetical protein
VEALELDGIADHVGTIAKPSSQSPQAPVLRVELIGDGCTAAGLTARGSSPVLQLCRELIEAGHDPARPLHTYRDGVLALVIRNLGEAAGLRVNPKSNGFVGPSDGPTGPLARQNADDLPEGGCAMSQHEKTTRLIEQAAAILSLSLARPLWGVQ